MRSGIVFRNIVFIVTFLLVRGPIDGQDSNALLDLLVKKKLITEKEANAVRTELTKDTNTKESSSGKWKLSTPITELELYGDARLRYEIRNGENQTDDTQQRNRERYRLRLGLRGILADDWFFGVRLETSQNPRSTNVTFADDSSNSSGGGGGPFAKGSDGISVGQAYLGYKGFRDITLTAGRMPNPMITTFMVWDPDINPEGLSEQWKHTFTIALGEKEEKGSAYAKDAKDGSASKNSDGPKLKIDVFANFGQFVYDDTNFENPFGARGTITQPGQRGS